MIAAQIFQREIILKTLALDMENVVGYNFGVLQNY